MDEGEFGIGKMFHLLHIEVNRTFLRRSLGAALGSPFLARVRMMQGVWGLGTLGARSENASVSIYRGKIPDFFPKCLDGWGLVNCSAGTGNAEKERGRQGAGSLIGKTVEPLRFTDKVSAGVEVVVHISSPHYMALLLHFFK